MLSQARPVRLDGSSLDGNRLRRNVIADRMSTFEAIAQARLTISEFPPDSGRVGEIHFAFPVVEVSLMKAPSRSPSRTGPTPLASSVASSVSRQETSVPRVPTSFQLFGYPGLAIIFFVMAAVGALGLMIQILRDDRAT